MAASVRALEAGTRDRLLAAAGDLFYSEGIQIVGVDRIVSKPKSPMPRSTTSSAVLPDLYATTLDIVANDGNLGGYRSLSALAPADERAAMIAVIFTIGYLAFNAPVVIAGLGTTHFGLHRTALVCCGTLAALSAVAASFVIRRPRLTKVPEPRTAHTDKCEATVVGSAASDIEAVGIGDTGPTGDRYGCPAARSGSRRDPRLVRPSWRPSIRLRSPATTPQLPTDDAAAPYLDRQPPGGLLSALVHRGSVVG
jgi:hypothetical protein